MATENTPETLLGSITHFADVDVATMFVASLRWPDGVTCPHCVGKECPYVASRRVWQCKGCRKQFSVKVGSIFEDSPIPLSKWLPAMWLLVNCKNGVSSYEIARDIGVTQKTAWFMLHRLRLAVTAKSFDKIAGDVEIDETCIGGARKMRSDKKARVTSGKRGGVSAKIAVKGVSPFRAVVLTGLKRHQTQPVVREHTEAGSAIYTDSYPSSGGLEADDVPGVINYAEASVDDVAHTNGLETFWSLLKRSLKGTCTSVEPLHLFRYLDKQVHRFNHRKGSDASRFVEAYQSVFSRRTNYADLAGNGLLGGC